MERVEGIVVDHGRVIGPAAAFVEHVGGKAGWCGHLDLPPGADLAAKAYEFRAADGRAGKLRVLWAVADAGRVLHAEFRGAGPFG